ncbi:MAG: DUF262 domain-containing protein [Hormoscilla sp. GM7CHS1pb]|nr:DUF262 domain-containing protein [Hormoscilla sp. GM7CHS1pb]
MSDNRYIDKPYLSIAYLINDIERGRIRIPSFQRGFVWDRDRVLYFIDSIYKGFPFGSVLIWRTRTPLRIERNLGPYKLPDNEPEYPIDYVLDGQQRITSIFGIFQNIIAPEKNEKTDWTDLYFKINSQESIPFCYLDSDEKPDLKKYFPLKLVFGSGRHKVTRDMDEEYADKIEGLVDRFKEANIPVERFETEERKYVATVFERINRQGLELNTFELLSVWNWSEDFDLQEKFREILEELEYFDFNESKSDLLLKCCSAVIKNSADPKDFLDMPSDEVREKFNEIKTGIFRAIDFLKTELRVFSLKLLPMENILVVLSSFFASSKKQAGTVPEKQNECIKKWFWRSCFSERYRRGGKNIEVDLEEIQKLKNGQDSELGKKINIPIDKNYFLQNNFRMSSIATKTFILILADKEPLNFIQGTKISLEDVLSQGNRKEFHHIFPKAYLQKGLKEDSDNQINCLANFCILSRTDNNEIKDSPPSEYISKISKDKILKSHFCFEVLHELLNNDFESFLDKRASLLFNRVRELSQLPQQKSEKGKRTS